MASSQIAGLTNPKNNHTTTQTNLDTYSVPEFNFSDVFGSLPVQPTLEEICVSRLKTLTSVKTKVFDSYKEKKKSVGLEDFQVLKVIGKGAFGKVYQVMKVSSNEIYAMKVIRKDLTLKNKQVDRINLEKEILAKVDHPFIVSLRYSFQTKYRLYLVLDFISGGDLSFQISLQGLFREDMARLYAAEIVSAVSHLHEKGIMHRDLKPHNILLGADGHVMLTDFGLAKQFDENTRSNTLCGTIDYMAPEVLKRQNHNKAADWWSFGIVLFEMLTGQLPFSGGNSRKIMETIMTKKLKLPQFLTAEAHSLLKGLLCKDSSLRLGYGPNGSEDIKRHKWFKGINWKKLEARELSPSFIPQLEGEHCIANFEKQLTEMPLLDSPASTPKSGENPFKGFTFVK